MKRSMRNFFTVFSYIFILHILLISCSKEDIFSNNKNTNSDSRSRSIQEGADRTDDQKLRDSIYYYYKLYSLWADESIPTYNHIYRFTDKYQSNNEVLGALQSLTPAYPNYPNGVYDRFSYLQELQNSNASMAKLKMDLNNGYGIYFSIGSTNSNIAYPMIYLVEGNSPAALAGLRRSDIVLELNGEKQLSIPVTCNSISCTPTDQNRYNTVLNLLNEAQGASTMQIKVQHADGSQEYKNLNYQTYNIDAVAHSNVFTYPSKNIGYLAMTSFEEIENFNQNQRRIDQVFQNFEQQQIRDLIVDLRYNTGGYVDAAVYIANKIINSNGDQKLMVKYLLNKHLSENKESSMFRDVYFKRSSQLELGTVYFLVSESTASAAEMLINVLRPYMHVRIISEKARTYGKPVGFFPQYIMNRIVFWPISFKLENADQYSDYWSGLTGDVQYVTDDIFSDFGDSQEAMIAAALSEALPVGKRSALRSRSLGAEPRKVTLSKINEIPEKGLLKTSQ